MSPSDADSADVLDVDLLMDDLRRRVAEKKAQGLYGVDALMEASVEDDGEPFGLEDLERLRTLAVQRVDIDTTASTKPVVGGVLSRVKRLLVRGASQPMYGMSARSTAFNGALLAYLSTLAREVSALERQVRASREEADRAAAEAQRLGAELAAARDRVARAEEGLARVSGAALPERLARLERSSAPRLASTPSAAAAGPEGATAGDPVRLRLEATEDDPGAAERLAAYGAALAGRGPVLHLGAGSGWALVHLGDAVEGVEADGELAAAAAAEGRSVRHADPVAYLAALAPGSLGGVLVTDLVERIDGVGLLALAAGIERALASDGRAIVEGRHPEALWALGTEFWRDAGRRRPLHPEAVRMALEAAGLGATSVDLHDAHVEQRIDPGPAGALAPAVERVNEVLFGPRRYAVHAAR